MTEAYLPSPHRIGSASTHQDDTLAARPVVSRQPADSVALLDAVRPARIESLYLHIPFCFHKCHYCDFYSIVDDHDRQAAFTDRLIAETRALASAAPQPVRPTTVFVGGGTPTLLRPELWRRLLDALRQSFDLSALAEFTVEANPETVNADLLAVLAAGGVNRMSVGAQSFNPAHLKALERWHDPANVPRALDLARSAGITNLSIDLIFAIPGQSLDDWAADLDLALSLDPSHLSCYSLTYEPNTPLTKKLDLGRIERTDDDLEAAMFEHTIDTLTAAGFEHYEVSNFARPGHRCRHNLAYWLNHNWLALGPSASGHLDGTRWKNTPHLGRYLASSNGCPITDVERLDPSASLGERLMLGLRLLDGIDLDALDPPLDPARRSAIDHHVASGHLEYPAGQAGPQSAKVRVTPGVIRLTRRGLLIADSILADLI